MKKESLPFDEVYCDVMWQNPDGDSSMYSVNHRDRKLDDGVFRIAGLGPGNYLVQLTTNPKETVKEANGTEPNPGRFFERRRLELLAGQTANEVISYVLFNPQAYLGAGKSPFRCSFVRELPAQEPSAIT